MRALAAFLLMAALALAGCATPLANTIDPPSQRVERPLTETWQFRYDNNWTPERAFAAPSGDFVSVDLPHTWNRLGEYRIGRTAATDNRQGKGWYRRVLDGRALDPTKRHFIEFDGVGNVADLWIGARHVGTHKGAFSRFRFELTDALDYVGENILLLRADNSDPQPGSSTEHVIPLLGDFFIHGGPYRPARLISVPPSHISLSDYGGPGVYADIDDREASGADITVRTKLAGTKVGQRQDIAILDADGRSVTRGHTALAGGEVEARVVLHISDPHRWDGRADPYLYRLVATLSEAGVVLDRVEQPLGIRTLRFDADQGFFLNSKHLPLHGVSRHQDYLGQGWVLSRADHERDMALIAEMGANTVRFAHYQHAQDWFELADRTGMAVWAELPFVNKIGFGDAEASQELIANARQQLIELIRQNYNHPSVITWGIGNEVDIDLAFGRLGPKADARPLLRELNALSHAEDPRRPTVIADCCEATPGDKVADLPVLTGEADLMGYNRYFGWYYGKVGDLGPHLDALHARHPGVPISVSEYGAGGALTQHNDAPDGRPVKPTGRPHPEEFQSWWHEQSWPQLRDRPYLWGNWIWNMFDFSSRVRQEGDATDINDKGLVSFDRRVKKDAFFYYKAQWSDEPVVHITRRRFDVRTDPVTRIKVYSNAANVAVTLNGVSLGDIACVDRICTIEDVRLSPGRNRVEARGRFGSGEVVDQIEWRLVAGD